MTNGEKQATELILSEVDKVVNKLQEHYEKFAATAGMPFIAIDKIKEMNKVFMDAYKSSARKSKA